MSVDLSQFHQVFFEESFEGLEAMEGGLLELLPDEVDTEVINTVFRAAHSIKGGSGTFGFSDVAEFTHVLETLLDEIRSDERDLTQEMIDLFLESVDCLKTMLQELQAENTPDLDYAKQLKVKFEAILAIEAGQEKSAAVNMQTQQADSAEPEEQTKNEADANASSGHWYIKFIPPEDIIRTGNEPSRILRELETLGRCLIEANVSKVPEFSLIDPELCYLDWKIKLYSDCKKEEIETVFEWVVDESDIDIEWVEEGALVVEDSDKNQTQENTPSPVESVNIVSEPTSNVEQTAPSQQTAKKDKPKKPKNKVSTESQSIRVGIDKVDSLINMVGELVITQSMLGQLGKDFSMDRLQKLQDGLAQLEHNTRELQESVMRIRMLPISFAFNRFPRLVRDLSQKLNKKIDLKLSGEGTELDKTVMEKIGDPLVHMVRNSLDHGIETPEKRLAAGKSETGTLTLNAFHQGGNIVIQIVDDGGGLNTAKIREKAIAQGMIQASDNLSDDLINDLIFQPGFSTAEVVSDVSGRGVGMDVVRRNIQELNGVVEVKSVPGVGSTFSIRLPLTLAILDGQLVRVGQETYILPLVSIVESIQIDMKLVNNVGGGFEVLRLRDEYVPIIRLFDVFNIEPDRRELRNGLLVVVEGDNRKVGFVVDELAAQQQVVIKSLEANYKKIDGVSGATILGDGTVAMILDVPGLVQVAGIHKMPAISSDNPHAA